MEYGNTQMVASSKMKNWKKCIKRGKKCIKINIVTNLCHNSIFVFVECLQEQIRWSQNLDEIFFCQSSFFSSHLHHSENNKLRVTTNTIFILFMYSKNTEYSIHIYVTPTKMNCLNVFYEWYSHHHHAASWSLPVSLCLINLNTMFLKYCEVFSQWYGSIAVFIHLENKKIVTLEI